MPEREFARICNPRYERAEQFFNVARFIADPSEQRHVGIAGEARLAPMLNGDPVDEAEAPLTASAELLNFLGRFEESVRPVHDCANGQRRAAFRSIRSHSHARCRRGVYRPVAACGMRPAGTPKATAPLAPGAAVLPAGGRSQAKLRRFPSVAPRIDSRNSPDERSADARSGADLSLRSDNWRASNCRVSYVEGIARADTGRGGARK